MLTLHELKWLLAWPFVPALCGSVKNDIQALLRSSEAGRPSVLEVGGRRSPYTIGLRACFQALLSCPEAEESRN